MKLTQRQESSNLDDNDLIHIVDVSNTTQSLQGSSFKVKLLSLLNYLRQKAITFTQQISFTLSPIFSNLLPNQYVKTDANKKLVTVSSIPFSDISGFSGASVAVLGNTLFVSSYAPLSNDLQTRASALGRIDKPFKTIQAAFNASNSGDTIYVFGGNYAESASVTGKSLRIILFDVSVNLIFTDSANNLKIEGFGNSIIGNLSLSDDNSGSGFVYANNLTINTYTLGFRGNVVFDKCTINNLTGGLGSSQSINAIDCAFNNIVLDNFSTGVFLTGVFRYCMFNNCQFIYTQPNSSTSYFYFENCNLIGTTFYAFHKRYVFKKCDLKNTTFNYTSSGAYPVLLFDFVLDLCTIRNFVFNDSASSVGSYSFILNVEKCITDFDFNSIITGNITTEGIAQNLMTAARVSKFLR